MGHARHAFLLVQVVFEAEFFRTNEPLCCVE